MASGDCGSSTARSSGSSHHCQKASTAARLRALLDQRWQQIGELEAPIATLNTEIEAIAAADEACQRLLIHGARAVLRGADKRSDRLGPWLRELKARRPMNVTAVALANKLACIAWAVLVQGEDYRPHLGLVEAA